MEYPLEQVIPVEVFETPAAWGRVGAGAGMRAGWYNRRAGDVGHGCSNTVIAGGTELCGAGTVAVEVGRGGGCGGEHRGDEDGLELHFWLTLG